MFEQDVGRTGWSGKDKLTGNVGMSAAYWFSILKISWIIRTINSILQFLYLANKFLDSFLIFD